MRDKSSLILNTFVVVVMRMALFVVFFTVRLPKIVMSLPMTKFPFIDVSPVNVLFAMDEGNEASVRPVNVAPVIFKV